MDSGLTRREILRVTLALSPIVVGACAPEPQSDSPEADSPRGESPLLTADDPVARSLAFYADTRDVPADHPLAANHDPNQRCIDCLHQRGPAGEGALRCPTFPGRSVSDNGWCSLWTKA